jgi:hypothetical protein
VLVELYDRSQLLFAGVDRTAAEAESDLDAIMEAINRHSGVRLFSPPGGVFPIVDAARRASRAQVVMLAVDPRFNGSNSEIATAVEAEERLATVYANLPITDVLSVLTDTQANISTEYGAAVEFGSYDASLGRREPASNGESSGSSVLTIVIPIFVVLLLLILVIFVVVRRRRE